jgi:hypothetical protein
MIAALDPLHLPLGPWHTFGLDLLSHLPQSVDFDSVLVVVDRLTRMAHFSLVQMRLLLLLKKKAKALLQVAYHLHDLSRVLISDIES